MTVITKPMLAADLKGEWTKLAFPQYGTTKLDGIRCLKVEGYGVVSRTFKKIANAYIREVLDLILPFGADGEILSGATFQECTHAVMSYDGTPEFKYHMFDLVTELDTPYLTRIENLKKWYETLTDKQKQVISLVLPTELKNQAEVEAFEQSCLDQGFEGVILRSGNSPYKCGRSTLRENYLTKVKRFEDSEAEIIDCEELMNNNNVATKDNFGRSERSSHKANLSGAGILGTLVVKDCKSGLTFRVGTGFDAAQRTAYWNDRVNLVGKIVKYKFFSVGVKELPRHPVFLGFRSLDDM
jgi:DNA ligase-1